MEVSAQGLQLIRKSEGFQGKAYKDVAGIPTIGYGHRIRRGESFSAGIGEDEATKILEADVREAVAAVNHLVKVALTQGQFDALVDFTFNLGAGRLTGSTLLRELNAGEYFAAGLQLLQWDHAGGQVMAGLRLRREAEYQLWTQIEAAA